MDRAVHASIVLGVAHSDALPFRQINSHAPLTTRCARHHPGDLAPDTSPACCRSLDHVAIVLDTAVVEEAAAPSRRDSALADRLGELGLIRASLPRSQAVNRLPCTPKHSQASRSSMIGRLLSRRTASPSLTA